VPVGVPVSGRDFLEDHPVVVSVVIRSNGDSSVLVGADHGARSWSRPTGSASFGWSRSVTHRGFVVPADRRTGFDLGLLIQAH
jgi:hypothetical protein